MLFLYSVILIIALRCFPVVKARPEFVATRYVNTTSSTGPTLHSDDANPPRSIFRPPLAAGSTLLPDITSLISTVTTSSSRTPSTKSRNATQNETAILFSHSTNSTHSKSSTHSTNHNATSSFSKINIPPKTTNAPPHNRCHSYAFGETVTSYFLSTVTITAMRSNFSFAQIDIGPKTIPPQPCRLAPSRETGRLPEGGEPQPNVLVRVTLKTTVVVPPSDTRLIAFPSPPPVAKTTTTPAPFVTSSTPKSPSDSSIPQVNTGNSIALPAGIPENPTGVGSSEILVPTAARPSPKFAPGLGSKQDGVTGTNFRPGPLGVLLSMTFLPPSPTKLTVSGVIISISLSSLNIGGQNIPNHPTLVPVTVDGQVFTINPSQVIGPGTTIQRPQLIPLTPTTIAGVPLAIGSSVAVLGGSTFAIGPGADPKTVHIGGQIISVGSDGIGFAKTTVPPAPAPSHPIIVGGIVVTAVGMSKAIVDGKTFNFSPGSEPQTQIVDDQTIKMGPSGIILASTTIGGPPNRGATQIATQGGLQLTQIGPDSVAIGGTTFYIGPGASPRTEIIDGQKVSIGSDGIEVGSTTVYPPYALPTSVVLAGGITVKQSGSLAFIGGKTFTIGPKATPTTATIDNQKVTIGQDGITVHKTIIHIPTSLSATTVTTAGGITLSEIGSTLAVIGSKTFTVGPQATMTKIVQNGQTITIGPRGVAIGSTTINAPFSPPATTITTAGGVAISEVGSTLAVIGGTTFTVGPGAPTTTLLSDGNMISIGTNGVVVGNTTISAPFIPSKTQIFEVGTITVSEIGSTLAVLVGTTFTIGPYATQTTKLIGGQTVRIGPEGVVFASTTIPFIPTRLVTAGGITFSEIGTTLAVIEGSTFTVGPGAKPTTKVYNGQTVSIGPGGIGLKFTTINFSATSPASGTAVSTSAAIQQKATASPTSKKKNGASVLNSPALCKLVALMATIYLL